MTFEPSLPPAAVWPTIPRSIQGPAGRIHIRQPWQVEANDEDTVGLWDTRLREISICRKMSRRMKWHVLAHEATHAALADVGTNLAPELEERICDAVATMFSAAVEHHMGYA